MKALGDCGLRQILSSRTKLKGTFVSRSKSISIVTGQYHHLSLSKKCQPNFSNCVSDPDVFIFGASLQGGIIDFNLFEQLWFQYLTSNNRGDPGNYLMGKIYFQ